MFEFMHNRNLKGHEIKTLKEQVVWIYKTEFE